MSHTKSCSLLFLTKKPWNNEHLFSDYLRRKQLCHGNLRYCYIGVVVINAPSLKTEFGVRSYI